MFRLLTHIRSTLLHQSTPRPSLPSSAHTFLPSLLAAPSATPLVQLVPPSLVQVRHASKLGKSGVKRFNHNRRRKGKNWGPKVTEGQFVQNGQVLFKQRGFQMHPGRNVHFGRDYTLYPLVDGFVRISDELVERTEKVKQITGDPSPYTERQFVHVEEQPAVRRIVCLNPQSLALIKEEE